MTLNGRTILKYSRVYVDGYDLSGYARSIGPLSCTFQEGSDDPLNAAIVGTWLGQATISPGTLNAMFDNTSDTGIHALMKTPPAKRTVMVAQGIQAIPAEGDPVFCGQFRQSDYIVDPGGTPSALTIKFSPNAADGTSLAYSEPWGKLLHAYGAATSDGNTAIGVDYGAASTDGGFAMYQIFAGAPAGGTAAIVVQQASTNDNASFATILTTTNIDVSVPSAGILALATTASVEQFIRWNVVCGTATSVTFSLAFIRGKYKGV